MVEGPGARRLFWILAIWSGVLACAACLTAYYMLRPANFEGLGRLGYLGLLYSPIQLIIAGLAAAVGLFARRKRLVRLACVLGATGVLAGAAALFPPLAIAKWAFNEGLPLDQSQALIPRFHASLPGPDKTVSYLTMPDGRALLMDIWQPAANTKSAGGLPVVVRIHGGAWVRGRRGELAEWNRWLRQLGFLVLDVDYRMPPEAGWRDEVGDVKCAIGWIVAHAQELEIDPKRIYLMGGSAGGNLAMLAAYGMSEKELEPTCSVSGVSIRGVINLYGPSDLATTYASTGSAGFIRPAMELYLGGKPGALGERYRLLSPLTYATSAVPTLIVFGARDRIIPPEQAVTLGAALTAAGVFNEVVEIPATDHAFDANWNGLATQIARTKIRSFLQAN